MPGRALAWLWLHEWEWVRSGGNTLACFSLAFTGPCSSVIAFSPYVQSWLPCPQGKEERCPRSSLAGAARVPAGATRVKKTCPKAQASGVPVKPPRFKAASPDWTMSLLSLQGLAGQTQRERPLGTTCRHGCLRLGAGSKSWQLGHRLHPSRGCVSVGAACLKSHSRSAAVSEFPLPLHSHS